MSAEEVLALHRKYEPDFKLWFHPSSGIEHCFRAPEHTEVATPKHVADDISEVQS